jgi:hypothetical protein
MSILLGSIDLDGSIASSGNISFTTSGSGVIQTITEFTPTGIASGSLNALSTTTTTYLTYGINIVATGSLTTSSYCCRLPEVPKKGKNVTVINNGGVDLFVFPSTASGDINGQIDGYFTIPSDGQSYVFQCYENPLPGGWSAINIPNGNTAYNSGIITYSSPNGQRLSFINDSVKTLTGNFATAGSVFPYGSIAEFGVITIGPSSSAAYYIPINNVWKQINSISIRTNIIGTFANLSTLTLNSQAKGAPFYAGTNTPAVNSGNNVPLWPNTTFESMLNSWGLQNNLGSSLGNSGNWTFSGVSEIGTSFNSVVPGTFNPAPSNPYISAGGVGAPGTMRLNWNINTTMSSIVKMIGKNYIGTAMGGLYNPSTFNSVDQLYDYYWYHSFSPVIKVAGVYNGSYITNVNDIKFQMTLNITPN